MTDPMNDLIADWFSAQEDFIAIAETLDDDDWYRASLCPGWTNGDVVAHVVDLEARLLGEVSDHEPAWADLPHTATSESKQTEIGVDARRGLSAEQVRSDLRRVITSRHQALLAGPQDPATLVPHPLGFELPLARLLQMRTLDSWIHEQDIRAVIGRPGNLGSRGAQSTADQLLSGLPMIWGKRVSAPSGATLVVHVTGPGVIRDVAVRMEPDGRARPCDIPSTATVTLSANWPTMLAALAGRSGGDPVETTGDTHLAALLMDQLRVVP